MKSSREQFEAWWATYVDKCSHLVEDVEYYAAKDAWQASRAAIEIELPEIVWDITECGSQHYDVDDVNGSIHAAGLTVKGDE